jgi:CheY-like chemotaxis protein
MNTLVHQYRKEIRKMQRKCIVRLIVLSLLIYSGTGFTGSHKGLPEIITGASWVDAQAVLCANENRKSNPTADGFEAIKEMQEGSFQLILMNVAMPGRNGMATSKDIRAYPAPNQHISSIALTASGHEKLNWFPWSRA